MTSLSANPEGLSAQEDPMIGMSTLEHTPAQQTVYRLMRTKHLLRSGDAPTVYSDGTLCIPTRGGYADVLVDPKGLVINAQVILAQGVRDAAARVSWVAELRDIAIALNPRTEV